MTRFYWKLEVECPTCKAKVLEECSGLAPDLPGSMRFHASRRRAGRKHHAKVRRELK